MIEAPTARTRHARWLFAGLPADYDRLAEWLSFGQNGRWRRFLISRVGKAGEAGGRVLDVATGTAGVAIALARANGPGGAAGATIVGLDQSEPMLQTGVRRVAEAGLAGRVRFVMGRGERLPFPDESFDAVTFTYLLRYVDEPLTTVAELSRVLKPGGTLANLEFHEPQNRFWWGLWWLWTRVGLPAAGRIFSPAWGEVGRFLGPSISGFYARYPLVDQLAMWRRAGIQDVRARLMSVGGGVVISGTKAASNG